jgi:heptosyltransferase-1
VNLAKILVVKMSALGDVVMALPALAALRRRYPEATIDWLVEPPAAGLLTGHPHLNRVIIAPRRRLSALARAGQMRSAWWLWSDFRRELKAVDYEVILDLQGLLKSAAMVWLAAGRRKVGFAGAREWTGWALTERMNPYDPERHAALRYLDAVAYLGADGPQAQPERYYDPPPAGVAEAEALLQPLGPLEANPYLVLNPGAKWATKRWPPHHWLGLAGRLLKSGFKLVLTGGPEDAPLGLALSRGHPADRILNICGRTSLPALARVLAQARAVITADTGPMHLAAAVGARGLALFGPTRPGRTGPWGGHFQILTPPLDCLGCLKKHCNRPCLERLTPEMVETALQNLLGVYLPGGPGYNMRPCSPAMREI